MSSTNCITFDEFLNINQDIALSDAINIFVVNKESESQQDEEDDDEGKDGLNQESPSRTEIINALNILKQFAGTTDVSQHFDECLNNVTYDYIINYERHKRVERSIRDYFC